MELLGDRAVVDEDPVGGVQIAVEGEAAVAVEIQRVGVAVRLYVEVAVLVRDEDAEGVINGEAPGSGAVQLDVHHRVEGLAVEEGPVAGAVVQIDAAEIPAVPLLLELARSGRGRRLRRGLRARLPAARIVRDAVEHFVERDRVDAGGRGVLRGEIEPGAADHQLQDAVGDAALHVAVRGGQDDLRAVRGPLHVGLLVLHADLRAAAALQRDVALALEQFAGEQGRVLVVVHRVERVGAVQRLVRVGGASAGAEGDGQDQGQCERKDFFMFVASFLCCSPASRRARAAWSGRA